MLAQLATIVNSGSLTRAAERLGVTQPTLTRNVKALEDRVGEPVLERSRHGVAPTEIGARLADVGNRIIEEAARADEIVRQWRQGFSYEVRIGVGPMLQAAVMNRFVETYPRGRKHVVHFKTGPASLLIPELQRGNIDLLLAPAFLDLEQSQLVRETVFDDEVRIMVGTKSRYYGETRVMSIGELKNENWLLSGAGAGLFEPRNHTGIDRQPEMIFTGAIGMVAHMLHTSDVVVRMPIRLMIMSGLITAANVLDVRGEATRRDIAIWSTHKALNQPAVREARERLRDYFAELNEMEPRIAAA